MIWRAHLLIVASTSATHISEHACRKGWHVISARLALPAVLRSNLGVSLGPPREAREDPAVYLQVNQEPQCSIAPAGTEVNNRDSTIWLPSPICIGKQSKVMDHRFMLYGWIRRENFIFHLA
jgi:hypothetical protein